MESRFEDPLDRARERLRVAHEIIDRLGLLDRWRACGDPVLAGAVALDLVVRPDIDLWVHCDNPGVECGMTILQEYARLPEVRQVLMRNDLDGRNVHGAGIFYRVDYAHAGWQWWRVEIGVFGRRAAEDVTTQLLPLLTDQRRRTILRLKEELLDESTWPPKPRVASIDVYRAVVAQPDREWTADDVMAWTSGRAPRGERDDEARPAE